MAATARLLDALAARFAGLAPSHRAAMQAMLAAEELFEMAKSHRCTGDQTRLER